MIRFKKINAYKYISKKIYGIDFAYWLVIDIINMEDAIGDTKHGKWNASVFAVSPSEAGEDHVRDAIKSCTPDRDPSLDMTDQEKAILLSDYGVMALVFSANGNNLRKLLQEARHNALGLGVYLFGFTMDNPQNQLGNTGWECMKGISSPPRRKKPKKAVYKEYPIIPVLHYTSNDSKV